MSKYHPKTVARAVLTILQDVEVDNPASIARKTGYNPKTIIKYIELLEDLGFVKVFRIKIGKREYKMCVLDV